LFAPFAEVFREIVLVDRETAFLADTNWTEDFCVTNSENGPFALIAYEMSGNVEGEREQNLDGTLRIVQFSASDTWNSWDAMN
jgi:hypothetical protein